MTFRIKPTGCDENYKDKLKVYQEHLSKFNHRNNSDLWRYFYWDFFHDGHIQKMMLWENRSEAVFFINCPNIKRKIGNDFEYINVDFKCTFRDVTYFHFDRDDPEDFTFGQCDPSQFIASEINTLTGIIESKSSEDNNFYSLIIEVLGVNRSFFIELVFSQVDVEAIENTAYELMLSADDFEVPIYTE